MQLQDKDAGPGGSFIVVHYDAKPPNLGTRSVSGLRVNIRVGAYVCVRITPSIRQKRAPTARGYMHDGDTDHLLRCDLRWPA